MRSEISGRTEELLGVVIIIVFVSVVFILACPRLKNLNAESDKKESKPTIPFEAQRDEIQNWIASCSLNDQSVARCQIKADQLFIETTYPDIDTTDHQGEP